jgi:hypothetical protein
MTGHTAGEVSKVARDTARDHVRAMERNVALHRENADLRGVAPKRTRGEIRDWTTRHVRRDSRRVAKRNRELERQAAQAAAAVGSTASAGLEAIAACESGGDPSAVDPSGTYRGKYQFDMQTWQSVGGTGDPAAAPEAEQDMRAAMLMERSGSSPWPVCG